MAKEQKDIVVGLDIGTAKIMALVAEVQADGQLKLAGLGVAPSNGLKRGVVVNIDATVASIQQALKEAELMADCQHHAAHVADGRRHRLHPGSRPRKQLRPRAARQPLCARYLIASWGWPGFSPGPARRAA